MKHARPIALVFIFLLSPFPLFAQERQFSTGSYLDVHSAFIAESSRLTDVQQEERWKGFEGRWVRWTGVVREVSKGLSGLYVSIDMGIGSIGSDVLLYPTDPNKEKALKVLKGDRLFFIGQLKRRPGKLLAMGLHNVEFVDPSALTEFYPILFVAPDVVIAYESLDVCKKVFQGSKDKARFVALVEKAVNQGQAGLIAARTPILLTGQVSGHFSQALVKGYSEPLWIANGHIRHAGVPIKDQD